VSSTTLERGPGVPPCAARRRWARDLTLGLERAGHPTMTVVETSEEGDLELTDGFFLRGGSVSARRQVARWLPELMRLKRESASLSGEILERYEEATLVYRICDRLGDVFGERAISVLVLDEARDRLAAEHAELWIREDDLYRRVAKVPIEQEGADIPPAVVTECVDQERPMLSVPGEPLHVCVPLPFSEPSHSGVMLFRGRTGDEPFRSGDVKLLQALATLAAAFIRNDHLAETARREEARRREDEIARQIHRSLLPLRAPQIEGVELYGTCHAADLIGGDYYGFWTDIGGRLGMIVADVSGHGIPAGLCMAEAKGVMQIETTRTAKLSDALGRINDDLTEGFSRNDMFVTASLARLDPESGKLSFGNAGHLPGLISRGDGSIEPLAIRGVALGIVPGIGYGSVERTLEPGDVLLLYTDGITETRDPTGEMYGSERLKSFLVEHRAAPLKDLCEQLIATTREFAKGVAVHDDQTVVAMRYVGHDGGAAS